MVIFQLESHLQAKTWRRWGSQSWRLFQPVQAKGPRWRWVVFGVLRTWTIGLCTSHSGHSLVDSGHSVHRCALSFGDWTIAVSRKSSCALQGRRNQEEPCDPVSRGRWWVTIAESGRDYDTHTWRVTEAQNLRILTQAGNRDHLASDNHGLTRLLSKGHISCQSREDSFRKPAWKARIEKRQKEVTRAGNPDCLPDCPFVHSFIPWYWRLHTVIQC